MALQKKIRKYNDEGWLLSTLSLISLKKTGGIGCYKQLNESQQEDLDLVYDSYVRICQNEDVIDFDDMIAGCLELLKNNFQILGGFRMVQE